MRMSEHLKLLDGQDYRSRIIERPLNDGTIGFYAWTPSWEGPIRPDYTAAAADLRDKEQVS